VLDLRRPYLIAVLHLPPTPGSPLYRGRPEAVVESAVRDARAALEGGCDALLVENFGDRPFHKDRVPPETVAAMALCLHEVARVAGAVPVGVNVLRNDARAALALCAATPAAFLRINVHSGVAVTDQGLVEGRAADTLRERARLAPAALILADVHVKHGSPLGGRPIDETARDTLGRGLADAVIVSGVATGAAAERNDLARVREAIGAGQLIVGSGVTRDNAAELLQLADGAIVGTWIKEGGRLENAIDAGRVRQLREVADRLRR